MTPEQPAEPPWFVEHDDAGSIYYVRLIAKWRRSAQKDIEVVASRRCRDGIAGRWGISLREIRRSSDGKAATRRFWLHDSEVGRLIQALQRGRFVLTDALLHETEPGAKL